MKLSMPKALIFTMNYWPEPTGFGPMTTDLADYLVSYDWEVTVLTGFPMAPKWEVYDGYRGRLYQREQRGKVDVRRVWVYVPRPRANGLMNTWKRIAYDSSFVTSALPVALTLDHHDVIVALCPPLQVGLASLALRRLWRAPVLYWLQDIVPDAAVSTGMMREGSALRVGRSLERRIYQAVDKIAIISPGYRANLQAKGVPVDKLVFLPNWANMARFDSGPDGREARTQLGLSESDFVVAHAGSVSAKQALENVVYAMKQLEPHPDIHLLIIGEGNQLDAVKNEVSRLRVTRVHFIPTVTGPAYVGLLRAADALILNQAREVKDVLIPSKLLTYLPSARPVIAAVHPESEAAHFLEQSGSAVLVEPESPEQLAQAIIDLKASPDRRAALGASGEAFVRRFYERSVLLSEFETTLTQLISGTKSNRQMSMR